MVSSECRYRSRAWAGRSVEVLVRVYPRCVTGLEDRWRRNPV